MTLQILSLELVSYQEVWELQRTLQRELIAGTGGEHLIICQHPETITIGRSGSRDNILAPPAELKERGVEVFEVERGGDVTFHGPGQLVAYPILNLANRRKDVGWYMRSLEQIVINTLQQLEITGERINGRTGVWTQGTENVIDSGAREDLSDGHCEGASGLERKRKLASIGVRISRWCTLHGLALNIEPLPGFTLINPCGCRDVDAISVRELLNAGSLSAGLSPAELWNVVKSSFIREFNALLVEPYNFQIEKVERRSELQPGNTNPIP